VRLLRRIINFIRFGEVSSEVKADINGTACEIAYYGRGGKMVGYWAYGYFDPRMPYKEV